MNVPYSKNDMLLSDQKLTNYNSTCWREICVLQLQPSKFTTKFKKILIREKVYFKSTECFSVYTLWKIHCHLQNVSNNLLLDIGE